MNILVRYKAHWQIKDKPHYKWTTCKKLINCQTNNEIKKTLKGSIPGYWIGKDFIKLTELKSRVVRIAPKKKLPF